MLLVRWRGKCLFLKRRRVVMPQRLSSCWSNDILPRRDSRPSELQMRGPTNQYPLYLMANNFQAASGKMAVSGSQPRPEPLQRRASWVLPGRRFNAPHCPSPLPEQAPSIGRPVDRHIREFRVASVYVHTSCPCASWLLSGTLERETRKQRVVCGQTRNVKRTEHANESACAQPATIQSKEEPGAVDCSLAEDLALKEMEAGPWELRGLTRQCRSAESYIKCSIGY